VNVQAGTASSQLSRGAPGSGGGSAPRPTVFIVDDDAAIRDSVGNLIRSVGLDVRLFGSAQEFLGTPEPEVPACVVLDVRLRVAHVARARSAGMDDWRTDQQTSRRQTWDQRSHRQGSSRPRDAKDAHGFDRRPRPDGRSARHHAPNIAIVDDDAAVRQSARNLFRSMGLKARAFASAEEFLPIVLVSGYPDDEMRTKTMQSGAVCVLTKPFEQGDLVDGVRSALTANDKD